MTASKFKGYPKSAALPFVSDFITIGHSLAGSYGATNDEFSWPYRVASALGADLQDRHVDGAWAALDDTTNSGDGGWATAAFYLDPQRTKPPYVAQNPMTSIYLGHNDEIGGQTAAGRAAMRAAMRGAIGHARAAARFNDNDTTVRTTGANETGAGSWVRGTAAAVQYSMNAQFTYTTAVNDELHIDVPAGYPINAIWIYTMSGGGVNSTLNGAVLANASSVVLANAASFPTSGTAKIIDTSVFPPNGPEDFFTWTGKSTNTLTGVPTSGANAVLAHNTGLTVVNCQNEGGSFTVDVDGNAASPPASQAFDTRNLGFQAAPARINGHGWRIPIPADGAAHEVTIKVTAINTAFYFDGWEIEASTPPMVILPMPIYGYWYELYTGYQYPPTDSSIDGLRTEIAALAAEFDQYVFTVDANAALNKQYKNFYQPLGSTTTSTLSAGATTIAVADLTNFPSAGNATIVDAGTPDTFTYTGKSAATGAGNLTGVTATGPLAVIAHASSGLKVAPTDGMHLSDEGHAIMAAQILNDIQSKTPADTTTKVASQTRRPDYSLRDLWKQPVRVASVGNISIPAPPTTIDGVTLLRGDRVLLKDQTLPAENGIYIYLGGAPPLMRAYDATSNGKLMDGTTVSVCEGAANADTDWTQTSNNPIILGTTSIRWTRLYPPPGSATAHRNPWNPTPTVGGGTLAQMRQLSMERNGALANIAAPASGVIRVAGGFIVPAGATVTNIAFASGATAATLPTAQWAGICDINRVLKGVSTDRTSEAWAAYVWKQFPLVTPWTPDVDTQVLLVLSTSATTTNPTMSGIAHSNASQMWAPVMGGTGGTVGTPPANGTTLAAFTATANLLLCGWS